MMFIVADSTPVDWAHYRVSQSVSSAAAVELLAVVAGVDLAIAQELIDVVAHQSNLFDAEQIWSRFRYVSETQLRQVKGISYKRAARILAALEFGKRVYAPPPQLPIIDVPAAAVNFLKYDLAYAETERFAVLVLDVRHRVIAKEVISIGSKTECIASPGEIFRSVLKHGGVRCIVAHNHPSGGVEASPQDLVMTRSLLSASKTLDIPILDHLILSGEDWYSIRQHSSFWQESSDFK